MSSEVDNAPNPAQTDWTKQVVENLVAAERRWIELSSEQNALTLKAIRDGLALYRSAPSSALAEWARRGVESLVEAQKLWVDNTTRQRDEYLRVQAQVTNATTNSPVANQTQMLSGAMQQQVEALVETRKRWLDFTAQQNAQFLKAVKSGLGLPESSPTTNWTEWAQQAVDNYVEVQKRWLDLATQLPFQAFNQRATPKDK